MSPDAPAQPADPMEGTRRYCLISPVRDEQEFVRRTLPRLVRSVKLASSRRGAPKASG